MPHQLTIRYDDALAREIEELAQAEGISLNQAAIRLLRKGAHLEELDRGTDRIGDTLDWFIGLLERGTGERARGGDRRLREGRRRALGMRAPRHECVLRSRPGPRAGLRGDLLIGVGDGGELLGLEADRFESEDRFLLHLGNVVARSLGTAAGTCIDPRIQTVEKKPVCVVTCKRSPEPVFLEGDLYVRIGPQTRAVGAAEVEGYIASRWPGWSRPEGEE